MKLPVHRIIPFSNVDGMGNRTSIFVQGCNANCLYCHNPETIAMKSDIAKLFSIDELLAVIKSNMPFIRGITVSGGEATLYKCFLVELFKRVYELGLTCYIDTNGFYNKDDMQELIANTDKFLYDIKGIGKSLKLLCFSSFQQVGSALAFNNSERFVTNNEHFSNLQHLLKIDKVEEVRLVYIKGYYDAKKVLEKIAEVLKPYPHVLLKLIRVHARGLPKERAVKLKGSIPSQTELAELERYARSLELKNIVTIY